MRKIGIIVLSIIVFCSFALSTEAQTSLLFTVSPARQQIVANPGEEFPITVTFFNRTEIPITGLIKVSDFIVEDDKGTPTFIEGAAHVSSKYSASSWVALPYDRINLGSNNKAVVIATIKIPSDAKPGGRYAAVYFEPVTGNQPVGEAGASITPRIASLIYIRVAGPISENAFVSSMFAPSFYEYGPIDVSSQIMNKGDYHIRPKGSIFVKDFLGGQADKVAIKQANIFPDSHYSYKTTVGQKWMIGKYSITLSAMYGSKDQIISHSIFVWVFPWRAIIIIILSLIILFVIGKYGYNTFIKRESTLQSELTRDREEIEKLKHQLENK